MDDGRVTASLVDGECVFLIGPVGYFDIFFFSFSASHWKKIPEMEASIGGISRTDGTECQTAV